MPIITDTPPNPACAEVTRLVLDRWTVHESGEQEAVAASMLGAWAGQDLPRELKSVSCFLSARGDAVLSYQLWTDARALDTRELSAALQQPPRASAEHTDTAEFVPLLSFTGEAPEKAGCFVLVTFDFDTRSQASGWIRLLADAIKTQPEPTPGCLSRHLFLSDNGRTVLLFSEWQSEDDHRRSLEAPIQTPQWRRTEGFPGLTHGPGFRCRLHGTVQGSDTTQVRR